MARPTNIIKGFINLTHQNGKQFLVSISIIATVRLVGEHTYVYLLHSPFTTGGGIQELVVLETYDEVAKRIAESA
jgi:uncharacterized protein YlzI (FlbEa/FlbD family)